MLRKMAWSLIVIIFIGFIYSCSKEDTDKRISKTSDKIKQGGTLNAYVLTNVSNLDPVQLVDSASYEIAYQLLEGLVELNEDLQIKPLIAESWETKDNKIWVFKIRKGIRFHDDIVFPGGKGRELTAHDVKYSLERVVDPKAKTTGSWILRGIVLGAEEYYKGKAKEIKGIKVIDDYTINIELTKPFYPFLARLSLIHCAIVPKEAVQKYGANFSKQPVGTGPFIISKLVPDQEVVLKKNHNYWDKDNSGIQLPYINEVKIRFIREEMIHFKEFETGNLDFSEIPSSVYPNVVDVNKTLKGSYSKYQLITTPLINVHFYAFTMTKIPLGNNQALRQAINYAVDKEAIVKNILKGKAVVARGVFPPIIPAYNSSIEGYPYDLKKAKEKLAEAGYPDGKGLSELTMLIDAGVQNEAVATAIQSQLSKIGIKTKIETAQFNTLIEMAAQEKIPIFRLWFESGYHEPDLLLIQFLTGFYPPNGFNFARYSNPKVDELYKKANESMKEEDRFRYYREAEKIIVNDAPWLFLYHTEANLLVQPYVKNLKLKGMLLKRFKHIWLNK